MRVGVRRNGYRLSERGTMLPPPIVPLDQSSAARDVLYRRASVRKPQEGRGMAHAAVCVTAPSRAEAKAIGRALVEARLAASVNIVPGVSSLYW